MFSGNEEEIECQGTGGFPRPTVLGFIGPEVNNENLQDIPLDVKDEGHSFDESSKEAIYTKLFKYMPDYKHQNYFVKCKTLQTFNGEDIYGIQVNTLSKVE